MQLNKQSLGERAALENAGFSLPQFDLNAVRRNTRERPEWVHFGAGNIFRAFPAMMMQQLLNAGAAETGIVVAEGYDYEIIDAAFAPHDNLSILVTLKADGSIEKDIVASVCEAYKAGREFPEDFARLREVFCAPSLKMASFTITEKGYSLAGANGQPLPDVAQDMKTGPDAATSYIGKVVSMLYARYQAGALPLAMVSMDNCSHNGDKLYAAVSAFAQAWAEKGLCDAGFAAYVADPTSVSFPWSMIDKITPRPDDSVKQMLLDCGFADAEPVTTTKHTYVAPFVNAEQTQYLVIEDQFPNGRPALEKSGVIFTDRETVDKVEKMKVCTCLNPLHTALAIFGCLLGYTKISDEMRDEQLVSLIQKIGYDEGMPVVVNPGILDPIDFIDTVLRERLPNPFMPDTPQRIASDTSQKLPIRFGETIKAYHNCKDLEVTSLRYIPLVLAGWLRYLLGIDDAGERFVVSPDPAAPALQHTLAGIRPGQTEGCEAVLAPILKDPTLFGVDLYEVGLGERVTALFKKLTAGKGAVRQTLVEMLSPVQH